MDMDPQGQVCAIQQLPSEPEVTPPVVPNLAPLVLAEPGPLHPVYVPATDSCPEIRKTVPGGPVTLPVPFPVHTSVSSSSPVVEPPVSVSTPPVGDAVPETAETNVAPNLPAASATAPSVARELQKLETPSLMPLPCDALKQCPVPLKEAVTEALGHPELRSDLCKIFDHEGFVLLSKEELQDVKLDARRRGREAAEAVPELRSKSEVQDDWETSKEKTVSSVTTNRWIPVPRQMTIQGQVIAFDFRMRLLDVEIVPKDGPKTTKPKGRKPRKKASSALGAPPADAATSSGTQDAPTLARNTSTSSDSTTPSSAPEEIDIFIGSPITID